MPEEHREPMEEYHEQLREPLDFAERHDHLLSCPNCDHFVKADDINIDQMVAKCSQCDHVFSFGHTFQHHGDAYSRPDMLIPEGLEVLKLRSELDIRVGWWRSSSKGAIGFLTLFTFIWNLVLLPFVITALATGEYYILLFTSLHLIVGLSLLARVMAHYLNTTTINLTRRYLEITTRPIRLFRKNRKIPVEQIKQLYVTKYVASRTNNQPNYAYALYAILTTGQKIKLVSGMNLTTQRYLEYEIESFLHIKDEKVSGELSKAVKS
ncbi:MAG: IBR domain-containing protein [Saprospiraceae bacterium]|nr:IBR domain-containing protein [Saprospiraceae bacterium]